MSQKYEYDPAHLYIERERTRSLLIETAKDEGLHTHYRKFFIVGVIALVIAGAWFAKNTQRGRDILDGLNRNPIAKGNKMRPGMLKNSADPDAFLENAEKVWSAQEKYDEAKKAGVDPDAADDLVQSRRDLSDRLDSLNLETVGAGGAPAPTVAQVQAAMNGQGGAPSGGAVRAARAPSESGIAAGDREALPPSLEMVRDGAPESAPTYRPVTALPRAYVNEKREFPDLKQ